METSICNRVHDNRMVMRHAQPVHSSRCVALPNFNSSMSLPTKNIAFFKRKTA